MTTRLAETPCPHCGHKLDAASGVTAPGVAEEPVPEPDDVTLCIACGEWCVFTLAPPAAGLTLRKPSEEELVDIGLNPLCRKARMAWVLTNGGRRPMEPTNG